MPTYTLLGISIYIPDLSEITQVITFPIQAQLANIGNQVIQGVAAQLYSVINPIIQPIYAALSLVATQVIAYLGPLISPILSILYGIANQIITSLQVVLSPIIGYILNVAAQVYAYLAPYINNAVAQMASFIQSYIIPILQGNFSALGTSVGQIFTFLYPIQSFLFGTVLNYLSSTGVNVAAILAQLPLIGTALSVFVQQQQKNQAQTQSALVDIGKSVVSAVSTNFIVPIQQAFSFIGGVLTKAVTELSQSVYSFMLSVSGGGIQGSTLRALGVLGFLGGVFVTTYVTATLTDLIHPLKKTKLQDLPEFVKGLVGGDAIAAVIMGAIASPMFAIPVRHELNSLLRPEIEGLSDLDEQLRRRIIAEGDYRTQTSYHGLTDEAITRRITLTEKLLGPEDLNKGVFRGVLDDSGWNLGLQKLGLSDQNISILHTTRYELPSLFILRGIFATGGISQQAMADILTRHGLNASDVATMIQGYLLASIKSDVDLIKVTLRDGFKKGWLSISQVQGSLKQLGQLPQAIVLFGQYAQLEYDIELREDQKSILKLAFEKGQITSDDLLAGLEALGMDGQKAKDLQTLEQLKVLPKPKPAKQETVSSPA